MYEHTNKPILPMDRQLSFEQLYEVMRCPSQGRIRVCKPMSGKCFALFVSDRESWDEDEMMFPAFEVGRVDLFYQRALLDAVRKGTRMHLFAMSAGQLYRYLGLVTITGGPYQDTSMSRTRRVYFKLKRAFA